MLLPGRGLRSEELAWSGLKSVFNWLLLGQGVLVAPIGGFWAAVVLAK